MRIVCLKTFLMKKNFPYCFRKLGNMSQNVSSGAFVIGALRVKIRFDQIMKNIYKRIHLGKISEMC